MENLKHIGLKYLRVYNMQQQDYAKHDFLKDIEVEGRVGGFKGDWIVGLALVAIVILVIIFPHGIK